MTLVILKALCLLMGLRSALRCEGAGQFIPQGMSPGDNILCDNGRIGSSADDNPCGKLPYAKQIFTHQRQTQCGVDWQT